MAYFELLTAQSVRLLANWGCDLSKRESQAVTPAFFAAQEGHTEILSLLLSLGANGGVARADGATPLIIASQSGHISCVKVLLNPPSVEPPSFSLPMMSPVTLERLLSNGNSAEVSQSPISGLEHHTSSGYTALCMAVIAGERQCAEYILSRGASPHALDRKGQSPLHLAAAAGDAAMCSLLLINGASPRRKAVNGLEPAIVAAIHGYASAALGIIQESGLDQADITDASGIPIAKYLAGLKRKAAVSGVRDNREGKPSGGNGYGDGCKPVAALLPASVPRLPPAGTGTSTSTSTERRSVTSSSSGKTNQTIRSPLRNGKISCTAARSSVVTITTGMATTETIVPRVTTAVALKSANGPEPIHTTTAISSNDYEAVRPHRQQEAPRSISRASSPERARCNNSSEGEKVSPVGQNKPWSGVHGGEERGAPSGIKTPGRRRPFTPAKGARRIKDKGVVSSTGVRKKRSDGKINKLDSVVKHAKEVKKVGRTAAAAAAADQGQQQQQLQEGHDTLLERMAAFLFDGKKEE